MRSLIESSKIFVMRDSGGGDQRSKDYNIVAMLLKLVIRTLGFFSHMINNLRPLMLLVELRVKGLNFVEGKLTLKLSTYGAVA